MQHYAFGKNWLQFLHREYSPEIVAIAQRKLLGRLRCTSLEGRSFLDIGSGSGLHSLAALRAGAARVRSFDYDADSVAATRWLWEQEGRPGHWSIERGDVLDKNFMHSLGLFDIVYSWGVLHHTGQVWQALENARTPLAPHGLFCIALYSDTAYRNGSLFGQPTPEGWLTIKQAYNRAGPARRRAMEWAYVWRKYFARAWPRPAALWKACGDLRAYVARYKANRGMEFWTDVRDWLGGWPMEFVREDQCADACHALGLELLDCITGQGNTEYVFRPAGARNHWDAILAGRREHALAGPFSHRCGHLYVAPSPLWDGCSLAANPTHRDQVSLLTLKEDGRPLAYRHSYVQGIEAFGLGRYCHLPDGLYFASSDNSDPNTNGRAYSVEYELP